MMAVKNTSEIIDADKCTEQMIRRILLKDKALDGLRALGELTAWEKIPFNESCGMCQVDVYEDEGRYHAQICSWMDVVNILNVEWDDLNDTLVLLDNCYVEKIEESEIADAIRMGYLVFYEDKKYGAFFKAK